MLERTSSQRWGASISLSDGYDGYGPTLDSNTIGPTMAGKLSIAAGLDLVFYAKANFYDIAGEKFNVKPGVTFEAEAICAR